MYPSDVQAHTCITLSNEYNKNVKKLLERKQKEMQMSETSTQCFLEEESSKSTKVVKNVSQDILKEHALFLLIATGSIACCSLDAASLLPRMLPRLRLYLLSRC